MELSWSKYNDVFKKGNEQGFHGYTGIVVADNITGYKILSKL